MRNPDEIDLEILQLLMEDARRPYSEIAEQVHLSPPAVSDRVERLQEMDIIRNFTLDIDQTKLQNRVPVFIRLNVEPKAVDQVFNRVYELKSTKHVFQLFNGDIVAHMNAPDRDVHSWFQDVLDVENIRSYEITPIAKYEWSVDVSPIDFTISCTVCNNKVKSDGKTARINGEIKMFCCPSCKARYEEEYESLH